MTKTTILSKEFWQDRIKNKTFWLAIISALILLVQAVAKVFGFELDLGDLEGNLLEVINTVFNLVTALGITVDPKTKGISDTYEVDCEENAEG